MKEIKIAVQNYNNTVTKLSEGVQNVHDELGRDGVIQRFEFTFEQFWKTLKLIMEFEGWPCKSPRSCIKEAYRHGFLDEGEIFFDMLDDRNRTSHTYIEEISIQIFNRIKADYCNKLMNMNAFFESYLND
jgi:nucleotidyltransferase substrate binding protein (TIGR01987 family)